MRNLFGHRVSAPAEYREWIESQLSEWSPEWLGNHQISPEESARISRSAVATRARILSAVYSGDYHTDAFDIERLAASVCNGTERIWFWGEPRELQRVRDSVDMDTPVLVPHVGTVSAIDASAEFGRGHLELCRSGSLSEVRATPFSLMRVLQFLRGELDGASTWHTLVLVPRVRRTSPAVRGGEAVNKLHRDKIRSCFLGFAPWYVMQGGYLEVLEYREVLRDRAAVLSALEDSAELFFAAELDRKYVASLLRLSFEATSLSLRTVQSSNAFLGGFRLASSCPESLRDFNHATWLPGGSDCQTVRDLVLQGTSYACLVVRIDLRDSTLVSLQSELNRSGFILTCFSPGKNWIGEARSEMWGYWARPNGRWPLAMPYYHDVLSESPEEHIVLGQLARFQELARLTRDTVHEPI